MSTIDLSDIEMEIDFLFTIFCNAWNTHKSQPNWMICYVGNIDGSQSLDVRNKRKMFDRSFSAGGLFNSSCPCNYINWQHCHIRVIIFPSDIVPNFQIIKACHFQGCNCVDLVTLLWSVVLQVSGGQQRQKEGEWLVASSSHWQERLLNPCQH